MVSYIDERQSCMAASPPFVAAASLGEGRVRLAVPKRSRSACAKGEKEEAERVGCTGTSSDELGHGGVEKKIGHHSLSPRLRQPHAGANEGA